MLRLGKLTDYAIVILSYMAKDSVPIHAAVEIAKATGVKPPTVSKLLKILLKAGLLRSIRGAKGGYLLARTPNKISVAAVINALEGPIGLTECSVSQHHCEQVVSCDIQGNWNLMNRTVTNALESVTLADMILPAKIPTEINVPVASLYR